MQKLTYIISRIDKALAFEWVADQIDKNKFSVSFILLNSGPSYLEDYLIKNKYSVHRITYKNKRDVVKASYKIFTILKKTKPDIIHCHLFDASLCGLAAGKVAGIKKRIYTRHHSSYHHIYYPHAVKYDRLCNKLSTHIVAITKNVKNILINWEKVPAEKVTVIFHGFELKKFEDVSINNVEILKNKYDIKKQYPIIGVISRYTVWKGIQYTIPAFKNLLIDYPEAVLLLCNARGEYKNQIQRLLNEIPKKNYREIEFENDLFALYKLFNIVIHVPIDDHSEAFGQVYVEALAAKIPRIFTLSGVASEFIENKKNALVVDYQNSEQILTSIHTLLKDKQVATNIITNGLQNVNEKFGLNKMIDSLERLYEND